MSSLEEVNTEPEQATPEVIIYQESKFQLRWQPLERTDEFIQNDGWKKNEIPNLLRNVPDHLVLNQLLQDILVWSLRKRNETQIVGTAVEVITTIPGTTQDRVSGIAQGSQSIPIVQALDDDDQATARIAAEPVEHNAPRLDGTDIRLTVNETLVADTSDASTISSTTSRRIRPLVSRLKQLRKDMTHKKSQRLKKNPQRESTETSVVGRPVNGECISCFDEYPMTDLTGLECSHTYCKTCLREVVLNAMKTESAFPPKCCLSEIPLKTALSCLSSKQRVEYMDKSAEYAIPAGHRWYCPEPKCAKWIRPENLHRDRKAQQTCPHCKSKICSHCRSLAHEGEGDCPEDFGLNSTLEVAEAEGWRRCYSCRTMVELTTGCRHITCKCGAEFCYVCNARWRTCNCTEADKERRLQQLRDQRVNREAQEAEENRRQAEDDAAALLEAEEVAEAIRQIEEMEREEAIRRVEEERQRQLEEELLLAQLEEARLLEEIAKREAEEEAERELRRILLSSSREECQALMETLMQLITHQHSTMMCDHAVREAACLQQEQDLILQSQRDASRMATWLQDNIEQRKGRLRLKYRENEDKLSRQFEEEEDDLFMQMTIHLRDKPNRERREKKMRDALQDQQTKERERLLADHERALAKLEYETRYELEGLARAAKTRLEIVEQQYQASLRELGQKVGSERCWLQLISTRRIEMLKTHQELVLEQLDAGNEPVGLLEDRATQVEPLIPEISEEVQVTAEDSTAIELEASSQNVDEQEDTDLYGGVTEQSTSEVAPLDNSNQEVSTLIRSDTTKRIPGSFPIATNSQESIPHGNTRKHKFTDSAISMSGMMAMSFVVHTDGDNDQSSSSSQAVQRISSVSGGSISTDSDLLDTISASKVSSREKSDTGRRSLFSKFRKNREISEEEIRRRMSSCVGDGYGR